VQKSTSKASHNKNSSKQIATQPVVHNRGKKINMPVTTDSTNKYKVDLFKHTAGTVQTSEATKGNKGTELRPRFTGTDWYQCTKAQPRKAIHKTTHKASGPSNKITSQARQIKNKAPQIAHIDTSQGTGSARHTAHTAGKVKRKDITRNQQRQQEGRKVGVVLGVSQ
jgi:hypothetical protein